jgi:hypothetical protein
MAVDLGAAVTSRVVPAQTNAIAAKATPIRTANRRTRMPQRCSMAHPREQRYDPTFASVTESAKIKIAKLRPGLGIRTQPGGARPGRR